MGDPAGIGPEITLKALARMTGQDAPDLIVVGCGDALEQAGRRLGLPVPPGISIEGVATTRGPALLAVDPHIAAPKLGEVSAVGGHFAFRSIAKAVELAMAGSIDGIVTAPLNKESLNLAGHAYAGHTDMLADLTGTSGTVMMLAHGDFRVTHLTTHVALADVPPLLTPQRLNHVITLTHDALRQLGIERPRIAVAALNPHAGEGGIFGREDIDISAPVIAEWVGRGIHIEGPVPGDTVFVKLKGGRYDAVIAMYHDQGHVPVKLLGFRTNPETGAWEELNGVNVTLGLPIIRTSVDHGTAFDIAGHGIASEVSMVEAIEYAVALAGARQSGQSAA
jgi:4-hydroxythreonine-4-phosphate dehydrogenase